MVERRQQHFLRDEARLAHRPLSLFCATGDTAWRLGVAIEDRNAPISVLGDTVRTA